MEKRNSLEEFYNEEKNISDILKIFKSPNFFKTSNSKIKYKDIILEKKVDDFIIWYYKNMVKGEYTDIGEYRVPIKIRNFIEKMAVWYELKYPEYVIDKKISGEITECEDFYDTKTFINSLPYSEKLYIQRPRYNELVYLDPDKRSARLHLTSRGFVDASEGVSIFTKNRVSDKELKMKHIKDVINLFNEREIILPINNELEETINDFKKRVYQKEELLNCVMYRIIERGGNRIGARRALLFAKEFERNIDIPMMYGMDITDPALKVFMNEYLKAGGKKDLACYINYFSLINQYQEVDMITVDEMLKIEVNNKKYTEEEKSLYKEFLTAISNKIDPIELEKEQVKQLRLERKN